ncbi:MAG: ribulose-phosphate 3-epimerase [Elusimicrobia bacterium]|nr:ribulose-phosphate 3-epimerase [Elusimicrobiota bacterium]
MALAKPDGRVRIVPSLLAADFGALREAAARVQPAADWVSVDVMDGHFVPNLSFGPDVVRALRASSGVGMDAHLMVERPASYARTFAEAGADVVVAHVEAADEPADFLRALGGLAQAGLALKPATGVEAVLPHLGRLDLVLVMTVEPGFGGQAFLPETLAKVRALREAIDRSGRPVWLMVDGGINAKTAAAAAEAGADALVAGNGVYRAADPAEAVRALRAAAQEAFDRGKRKVSP